MAKKEIISMILAGGQGSRLGTLTQNMAKPAVPYGSRYRIIDFPLSNCVNSGISTVGILTQYQPLGLNTYIGNGHPWDLDRSLGGAFILPPYQRSSGSDWYKNTANAIYQNREFIDMFSPKYVLILSGDHIYKMNYSNMLKKHVDSGASATIAVFEVPMEEAYRFGIMNVDSDDRIIEFEEKPAHAKSNLASMGIYIFNWDQLRQALINDEADTNSVHDFGKNIIPNYLACGYKLQAYRFDGYWKDVGTIASLWEANMDILDYPEAINLRDDSWRIYSRNPVKPAHFIAETARVHNSAMTDGCQIYGKVEHSLLSASCIVEAGAEVIDSVLMPGTHVKAGAKLERVIAGINSVIGEGVVIGSISGLTDSPYRNKLCTEGVSVINHGVTIKAGSKLPAEVMVNAGLNVSAEQNVVEKEVAILWEGNL
ncbi:glucose-1-phosphate adenylyltransferase [Amygdalobacter nucleatus]|uniref:Glucose-1-phosphate adenylyltransferase n=1 Tax=Amygdalobacter nucleatus TaxID=3029274 RepID=A0A133YH63_9FIRM|nr:glucose-1-phosphate adenylyltransferase [Amygdalobacter nucleatus]KXB42531.1 glucose-1-phosphate adenylyltransferase [Amygdalobacter nucleatus]MDF0486105.1 glucose-1-phosphate adenylyltransferase [Amygdalobacter nucleatus]